MEILKINSINTINHWRPGKAEVDRHADRKSFVKWLLMMYKYLDSLIVQMKWLYKCFIIREKGSDNAEWAPAGKKKNRFGGNEDAGFDLCRSLTVWNHESKEQWEQAAAAGPLFSPCTFDWHHYADL